MKDRNNVIYFAEIIVIIIVYLVIYLFGVTIKRNIYAEGEGYQHNPSSQPINNITTSIIDIINPVVFSYDYEEGNHIELYNQFPTKDEVGMAFVGNKYTHDFRLKLNYKAIGIHYVITLQKQADSDLEEEWTKTYLTADGVGVLNCYRDNGRIKTFNEYPNYLGNPNEKILYAGVITYAEAIRGYKDFTLRMWVSEDLKVYNDEYLQRSFKARVTVYSVR